MKPIFYSQEMGGLERFCAQGLWGPTRYQFKVRARKADIYTQQATEAKDLRSGCVFHPS